MNVGAVIKILKKELDVTIKPEYYEKIDLWAQWWKGYVDSFHKYREMDDKGGKIERKLYTLKMAKKICEDWASTLLNEKTELIIADLASSVFVQGKENEKGGVLKQINFWSKANKLIEKSFYSGTGAFVQKLDDLQVDVNGAVIGGGTIRMEYLPAFCIFPLTVKYDKITEVAFASENLVRGKKYIYVETHTIEKGVYVIGNSYYEMDGGEPVKRDLPKGIAPRINTGSPYPFFGIVHPNIVNPYSEDTGLGCSVFAHALDNLKGVDLAFNNFCRDFRLGGKKVFYSRELTKVAGTDKDGNPIYITPDDMMQQLFVSIGDENVDDKKLVHEFNPDLRVGDNKDGLQAQLDYASFKCGLGTRRYRFDTASQSITATQYSGERQELRQNAEKHGIVVKEALADVIRAILWAGKNILGESVDPETEISIELADGYIISDEERLEGMRQDVVAGILRPEYYLMDKYKVSREKVSEMMPGMEWITE